MKISTSRIKLFKACRKAYYFKYIEDLEPIQKADALQVGTTYHELVEQIYDGVDQTMTTELSKESAMANAYKKYVYPVLKVSATEKWLERNITDNDVLIGRVDGIANNGWLVEHKTASGDITEQYEYDLQWDDQVLAYMWLAGVNDMFYTVCRKPTIRQKQAESEEEFYQRMCGWYDTDTYNKIRVFIVHRSDDEIQKFVDETRLILDEMKSCAIYKNQSYCNHWGRRCEYSGICLDYVHGQECAGFYKGGRI